MYHGYALHSICKLKYLLWLSGGSLFLTLIPTLVNFYLGTKTLATVNIWKVSKFLIFLEMLATSLPGSQIWDFSANLFECHSSKIVKVEMHSEKII